MNTPRGEGMPELPPLPEPDDTDDATYAAHSDEQMHAYAIAYGQQCWQAATQRERELETVLRDLLERNDAVYQTEYDGRMLTCCIGCDADLASNEHEKSCPVVHALTVLASIGKSQSNGRS